MIRIKKYVNRQYLTRNKFEKLLNIWSCVEPGCSNEWGASGIGSGSNSVLALREWLTEVRLVQNYFVCRWHQSFGRVLVALMTAYFYRETLIRYTSGHRQTNFPSTSENAQWSTSENVLISLTNLARTNSRGQRKKRTWEYGLEVVWKRQFIVMLFIKDLTYLGTSETDL